MAQVDLYPEGGVVISGLPTTLYVMAMLPSGEPGYIEGEVGTVLESQKTILHHQKLFARHHILIHLL